MNVQSRPWPVAVALVLGLTLSSCAIDEPASGDAPSSADRKKDRKKDRAKERQRDRKQKTAAPMPAPKPSPTQVWVCSWSPTYDDDWHNDVLCDNGIASERPRLREGDDFVEQAEMMESAREYARQRNAG